MLCHTCTESNNQHGVCEHSQEVRALTGVGEITAVWHFESRSSNGFTGYSQIFLQRKQDMYMWDASLHLLDAPLRNNHYFYSDKLGKVVRRCVGSCAVLCFPLEGVVDPSLLLAASTTAANRSDLEPLQEPRAALRHHIVLSLPVETRDFQTLCSCDFAFWPTFVHFLRSPCFPLWGAPHLLSASYTIHHHRREQHTHLASFV